MLVIGAAVFESAILSNDSSETFFLTLALMNPTKRVFSSICLFISLSYVALDADPVRVFYDVGPAPYEVSQFDKGLPVLDTPLDSDVERKRFDGKWSYSGELPLNPEFMSMVYPYRIRKEPGVYSNRGLAPRYYAHLHAGFSDSLAWKLNGKRDNLVVFGWLLGEELKGLMAATPKAFRLFSSHLKLEGEGIDPRGVLVAWMIDEAGALVPLDKTNETPMDLLRLAALNGDLKGLSERIEKNPKSLKLKDGDEKTLLMYAALGGRTEIAEYLLEQGIDAFEEDKARSGALEIAAESGWLDIVKAIATRKPKGSDEKVQYTIAAVNAYNARHQEIAIHLMGLGASVDLDKKTAPKKMLGLLASECVLLARWVEEEYKVKGSYSDDGTNFIHAAVGYGDVALLESLRAEGASITEETSKGLTPLLIACGLGNRNAICWLMENGGRPGESEGLDPVMHAIREGVHESVSCLIDYGVSVNREENEGASPLMYASSLGEKEIAETLLDAGAVWLFDSKYSDYALIQLLRMDSPKLIEGLFEQGLSLEHAFSSGARLIEVAAFYNADHVVSLLKERSPGLESSLISAKDLAAKPEIVSRTNVDYPFELQEKYGDFDVLLKMGVSSGGSVAAIEIDESVPDEIRSLLELSLLSWSFKPLEMEETESLAVMKFKLPLRMSIRESDIFSLKDVGEKPRAIYQVRPKYPYQLKQAGISGWVQLEWIIDPQGVVRFPKALKSSNQEFSEVAIESIRQSRWKPAKNNGVPVAVRVTQRMDFNPSKKPTK